MKKILLLTCTLLLLLSTSFKSENVTRYDDTYYFMIICEPAGTNTQYISKMIFSCYTDMRKSNDQYGKAAAEFSDHLKTEYNVTGRMWKMGSYADGLKTDQEAQNYQNKYVARLKELGIGVEKTNFRYNCEE